MKHRFASLVIVATICWIQAGQFHCHAAEPAVSLDPPGEHAVVATDDSAVIEIRSAKGIGRTTVKNDGEKWPDRLVVRLYLRGLENLELRGESMVLTTSFSSTGAVPRPTMKRLTDDKGAGAIRLDKGDPHSLNVRAVAKDGPGKIPLDGYFEVEIPAKFLEDNPAGFKLHWIDFYR